MCARHFVVRNNFIIPIDNVERAIGAKVNRNRAKPLVFGGEKVGQFFVTVARALGRRLNRVDRVGDGVGEEENLRAIGRRGAEAAEKSVRILGEGKSAQPRATHLRGRERWRHQRLIRAQPIFRSRGHPNARLKRNDGIAEIVGLLHKDFAFTRADQTPNIIGSGGETFKIRAIGSEAAKFTLVERNFGGAIREGAVPRAAHLGIIKEPLRR